VSAARRESPSNTARPAGAAAQAVRCASKAARSQPARLILDELDFGGRRRGGHARRGTGHSAGRAAHRAQPDGRAGGRRAGEEHGLQSGRASCAGGARLDRATRGRIADFNALPRLQYITRARLLLRARCAAAAQPCRAATATQRAPRTASGARLMTRRSTPRRATQRRSQVRARASMLRAHRGRGEPAAPRLLGRLKAQGLFSTLSSRSASG